MDFNLLSSIVTVVSFIVFIGILLWAYSRGNKERFERLGRMDMDIDSELTGN